jgi:heme/copper-type cytochrome/quinol oxidase subunit 3
MSSAQTATGVSHNKLGMWLFLASDCLLFGALISTYLVNHDRIAADQIGPHEIFDIPFTSVSSFVLLMSSLTMVLSLSALQRGDVVRNRLWLFVTAMLGATFVGGQVYEFTTFYKEGLGYTTNIFSSSFYTMTGFHGVHVTVGIIMLMTLMLKSLRGNLKQENAETVEIVGLYWHFVDIVWILIFTIVYLLAPGAGS